jgi:alginate O-acetyltransferase complex protein AlgI
MLFNSFIYLGIFLPVTALVYFAIGSQLNHRLSITWLVAASLFFYGWWNPAYLGLILGSGLFNFAVGMTLNKRHGFGERARLALLSVGIAVDISLLAYFKYANFFIDNVNWLIGSEFSVGQILLPLAISFVTFQQISYLVDAYRGETKDYNFLHYMLFVTFFPQLIAGPIVHHSEMMPQFDKDKTYKPKWQNLEIGLTILIIGLFKKVVLADTIAASARPIFMAAEAGDALSITGAWMGAVAFALQLYFDFSGYSDMAIGSARIFGIKLPINFYSPYKALNIADFWRRWHMTLTRFITAYLYMPMSIKMARLCATRDWGNQPQFWLSVAYPAMVTFILAGLWHGAGWNFVIFGFLQGAFMIINSLWREFRKNMLGQKLKKTTPLGRLAARALTIAVFIWSLIFFRAETTDGAIFLASSMIGLQNNAFALGESWLNPTIALEILLFTIIFLLPNTQQLMMNFEPSLETPRKEQLTWVERIRWQPNRGWALAVGLMLGIAIMHMNQVSEFIYFQF